MHKAGKEADWYCLKDIRARLNLTFEGTALTSTDFLKMVLSKIDEVNERLKGQRIHVKDSSIDKYVPPDFIFKFRVSLFGREWTIYQGFTHFQQLAADLKKLPGDQVSLSLPELPSRPADFSASHQSQLLAVGDALATELASVLQKSECQKKAKAVLNFLSISKPFCELRYEKIYEFACEKHSSGPINEALLVKTLKSVFRGYHKRWVVISATNLFYYATAEDRGSEMKDNISFDAQTNVKLLECHPGNVVLEFTLSRRSVKLRVSDLLKGVLSLHYIAKLYRKSAYCRSHRFDSFAPVRQNNDCQLFADGACYFRELYEHLEQAEHTIMITDWWFAPEMPLLRRDDLDLETEVSRIDFTLARAADRGVKVYVIVYREMSQTLGNDSEHAKKRLESLSPNIKVLRHPNVIVSLWSHHEKMVAIDKRVVFMGGLDICWGRWDDHEHRLFNPAHSSLFPGADYYNPLKKDITRGRLYKNAWIPTTHPRMPWHDIAAKLTGKIVIDYTNHFITYWNHARENSNEAEILFAKRLSQVSLKELPTPSPDTPDDAVDVVPIDPYESNPGASTAVFVFETSHLEDHPLDQLADAQIRLASIVRAGRSSFTDPTDSNSSDNNKLLEAEYNRQLLATSEGKHDSIIPDVEIIDVAATDDYSTTPTPADAANNTFTFEAQNDFCMSSNNCDQYAFSHLPSAEDTRATFEPIRDSLGGLPEDDEDPAFDEPADGRPEDLVSSEVSQITGNTSAQEAPAISAELASFVEEDTGRLAMQALRSASKWSQALHLHREPVLHLLHLGPRRQERDRPVSRRPHRQSLPRRIAVQSRHLHAADAFLRSEPRGLQRQSHAVPNRSAEPHHRERKEVAAHATARKDTGFCWRQGRGLHPDLQSAQVGATAGGQRSDHRDHLHPLEGTSQSRSS